MPGGVQVIHEPWRMALSYLWQAFGEDWQRHLLSSLAACYPAQSLKLVEQLLRSSTRLPLTSSCGRLCDAVAALTLGRTHVMYEAQAAVALEACFDSREHLGAYPFAIHGHDRLQMDTAPLFAALTQDLRHNVSACDIATRFHNGLINALMEAACRVARRKFAGSHNPRRSSLATHQRVDDSSGPDGPQLPID